MCGIFVTYGNERPFHHRQLRGLKKRGPDDIGFWSDGRLHMAHTRLAIVGLDDRGVEPLENATHVLAYNGEIYNFLEINRRLAAAGVHVSGANDAETLLGAWSQWGEEILPELNGFWAFVVYDKKRRKVTLVRDQMGVKPLYYSVTPRGGFVVSSLIGTIVDALGEVPPLDYAALSEYVRYQFTFEDRTFFKTIKKVLPGSIVEIDLESGATSTRCYEDIFGVGGGEELATPEWMNETRELFLRCCVESAISDTSFTTFCSGGIDSSMITAAVRPEIAYHCNYSDPECNETFYAQQVVEALPTRLFVVNAQESFNLVERVDDILEDFDELTIGSVILPLDDLLAQVKRRFKVILTGTGGDELFSGYVRYQLAMGQCFHDSYRGLFTKMHSLALPAERFELAHRKGDPRFYRFYEPSAEVAFKTAYEACGAAGDELRRMMTFDRRYFLSGLLNIDDKMCGRHSLEGRPSFLHQKFVRHVLRLSSSELIKGDELKYVGRRLAEGVIPKSVIHRKDKMGFTTPIGTFVNESSHLIREQLIGSKFRELYDLGRMNLTAETKFSREVFGLLMLDLWLNRYATARGANA